MNGIKILDCELLLTSHITLYIRVNWPHGYEGKKTLDFVMDKYWDLSVGANKTHKFHCHIGRHLQYCCFSFSQVRLTLERVRKKMYGEYDEMKRKIQELTNELAVCTHVY